MTDRADAILPIQKSLPLQKSNVVSAEIRMFGYLFLLFLFVLFIYTNLFLFIQLCFSKDICTRWDFYMADVCTFKQIDSYCNTITLWYFKIFKQGNLALSSPICQPNQPNRTCPIPPHFNSERDRKIVQRGLVRYRG